jgi:hypothetical protein
VHDGLGETRCVILHANGFPRLVDLNVPYAIDLANLCQSHRCSLAGPCAVLIHHVKLCHGIDFTARWLGLGVQFLDVLEEAWAGEILRADQLATDDAALVDDVGFRELEAAIELVRGLVLIEDGEQAEMFLGDVVLVLGEGFVAVDGHDLDAGHLVLEGLETGHFFDAGGTPAGPEIQDNHFALKALQVYRVLAIADGERWGYTADLVGKSTSIAAGSEGAGEEDQKSRTLDLPHHSHSSHLFL